MYVAYYTEKEAEDAWRFIVQCIEAQSMVISGERDESGRWVTRAG
jgi:hypothetical protein